MTDEPELLPDEEHGSTESDADNGALLSEERFDDALDTLEDYADRAGEDTDLEDDFAATEETRAENETDLAELEDEERLRQPRAQLFRRRLRDQINMLPLALYLLVLGAYLIARQQDVEGLPDLSTLMIGEISALALAFTAIFRSLLSGRQERGLLLIGVWGWVTAGMVYLLVYVVDRHPDAREWWPLLVWSLGVSFVLIYPVERTHDARLIWLGIVTLAAGGIAYAITSDRLDEQSLEDAVDYWPLLLAVAGVGLLPLAFRRRTGQ